jgi:hypothetical protein
VDKKIILWSIALFFGCTILFKAVHDATAGQGANVKAGAQVATLVLVLVVVVVVAKRRQKP